MLLGRQWFNLNGLINLVNKKLKMKLKIKYLVLLYNQIKIICIEMF